MREFELLKSTTHCPFAIGAKIWTGPRWNSQISQMHCLERCAHDLGDFTRVAADRGYDGYVAEVGFLPGVETNLDGVRKTFHWFLRELSKYDESCRQCMAKDYLDKSWQFEYGSVRMFLNVFSSCYPQLHSKYVAIEGAFFVFFQPEFSFRKYKLNHAMTAHIRGRFSAAGIPYNGHQIDERIEALLYMFPENLWDPPVRWWL